MKVLEHFLEGVGGMGTAHAIVDVGEESGDDINPIVAVWDAVGIVSESV